MNIYNSIVLLTFVTLTISDSQSVLSKNETEVFCDGEVDESEEVIHFKSPNYPQTESDRLTHCKLKVKLYSQVQALRIEFINVTMDGQLIAGDKLRTSSCDSDMFIFRGFHGWTPPARCGKLTGYSFVLTKSYTVTLEFLPYLEIIGILSSFEHSWYIKVTKLRTKVLIDKNISRSKTNTLNNCIRESSSAFPAVKFIHNGKDADSSLVPFQASLRYKKPISPMSPPEFKNPNAGQHFCGGVIVGERYVLTAAHCFYGRSKYISMKNITELKIVLGSSNINNEDMDTSHFADKEYEIESVVIHYAYDPNFGINDVAMIILKKKIALVPGDIEIIPLANWVSAFRSRSWNHKFKTAFVSGFGSWQHTQRDYNKTKLFDSSFKSFPYQLQVGEVKFSNGCHCVQLDKGINNQYSICSLLSHPKYHQVYEEFTHAFCSETDALLGQYSKIGSEDSGGPLFIHEPEIPKDFNLTSYLRELRINNSKVEAEGSPKPQTDNTHPALLGIILRNMNRNNRTYSYYLNTREYDTWISSVILFTDHGCTIPGKTRELNNQTLITEEMALERRKVFRNEAIYREQTCSFYLDQKLTNSEECGYDTTALKTYFEKLRNETCAQEGLDCKIPDLEADWQ